MTTTAPQAATAPPLPSAPRGSGRSGWFQDLLTGLRFAFGGGREGWSRTLLTAAGVGAAVAVLLGAASTPHLLAERAARGDARTASAVRDPGSAARSDSTVLYSTTESDYRSETIWGTYLKAEGNAPALPPGLPGLPADGEMYASPALRDLLGTEEGALLRERLPQKIVGTIGDAGLVNPRELLFYAGHDALTPGEAGRTEGFGLASEGDDLAPSLVILITLMCVVLLTPVAVFIATAVRFGGERRDRRLAALRLVGADRPTVRRIAAGEALGGALLGLAVGGVLFLALRPPAQYVEVWDVGVFAGDLVPDPLLGLVVLLGVPLAAVLVTLVSLKSVAIEPLGVVRHAKPRRRRLWWRLLLPVLGVALLLPFSGDVGFRDVMYSEYVIGAGSALVLIGLIALLPWAVEAVVRRLRGGPVPWQLATRRLQLESGSVSRSVGGITVAVAGAIAIQMLLGSMHEDFIKLTGQDPARAEVGVATNHADGELAQRMIADFRATEGVRKVIGTVNVYATRPGPYKGDIRPTTELHVADCATLRELARIDRCEDGDTFVAHSPDEEMNAWVDQSARPGKPVNLGDNPEDAGFSDHEPTGEILWTLPADSPVVRTRKDPGGNHRDGIYVTPSAIGKELERAPAMTTAMIKLDLSVPDGVEHVRNTAAAIDPTMRVTNFIAVTRDRNYASAQTALMVGASVLLVLIAASLLVSTTEQLRERRRVLAALVAFGTPRRTLAWSTLWQTAVPVVLGIGVAVLGGLGLGAVMTGVIGKPVQSWWVFWPYALTGAGVTLLITLASLPPLLRMTRPDGLRTE
ncbi:MULTISPECIES: FtsX-like permease family protein [Streptomyces]|uniref:FtsX-like permease family protein n=1 Tax=Streptomyces rutgersensis TaxID=53451 RepID=A0ABX6RNI0_9ACTN|nr:MULTISPECIES: FtsX-like permease family protein [Streptomyces]NEE35950.1 FtsX-like permease family protein [Streptomyces sp. SID7982]PJM84883.1 hypothetical protein CH313_02550 [Streptomyces sp. TSRI0384-2]QNE81264.1 FtsX-like permease family protein [Streptomyces rutgersensis]